MDKFEMVRKYRDRGFSIIPVKTRSFISAKDAEFPPPLVTKEEL